MIGLPCAFFFAISNIFLDKSTPITSYPLSSSRVFLNDLVESGAWLDLELKRPFLALWVNDKDFDNPDLDDPIEILTNSDAHKFAAMDPVVDLESLRGMKVKLVYDD